MKVKKPQQKPRWVEEETAYLRQTWGRFEPSRVAAVLGKSQGAVRLMAQRLCLSPWRRARFSQLSLSSEEKAYLAGLFDGEGSIMLRKSFCRGYQCWQPHLNITNTSLPLMRWVEKAIQCPIRACLNKDPARQRDGMKIDAFSSDRVQEILRAVLPCLIAKKAQAELLLEFYSVHQFHGTNSREEEIYQELRLLNKKGPKVCK